MPTRAEDASQGSAILRAQNRNAEGQERHWPQGAMGANRCDFGLKGEHTTHRSVTGSTLPACLTDSHPSPCSAAAGEAFPRRRTSTAR